MRTPGHALTAKRGRHRSGSLWRWVTIALVVVAVCMFIVAGVAYAGFRYEDARSDRAMPGVRIADVDVGGMNRSQMEAALRPSVRALLDRPVRILVGSRMVTRTAASLGAAVDVEPAIDEALRRTASLSWPTRLYHHVLGRAVPLNLDLTVEFERAPVAAFVRGEAGDVDRPAVDASVEVTDDGRVVAHHDRPGRELDVRAARSVLEAALRDGRTAVVLPTRSVAPAVRERDLGALIVVRLSKLRLFLYQGTRPVKSYPVAAGRIGVYDTPQGHWEITAKRANPTWYNPALDTWGAGEPAMVPPGPGNPMGPRALNLNVGLIRIHGTNDESSIGHFVSHGCVRMHNADVIDLFDRVEVGTPVVIVW
jgi:L,D-transpeptidase catalytic domain/Putative peptidoglycan binding domain